jgi:chromosome segregation ATPase
MANSDNIPWHDFVRREVDVLRGEYLRALDALTARFNEQIGALHRQLQERFEAQQRAVSAYSEANQRALEKVNEFRQALQDQNERFATVEGERGLAIRLDVHNQEANRRLSAIELAMAAGRETGTQVSTDLVQLKADTSVLKAAMSEHEGQAKQTRMFLLYMGIVLAALTVLEHFLWR